MQPQTSKNRFYGILRAACIVMAVLMLTLASGCDLFGAAEDKVTVSPKTAELEIGETIGLLATSSEGLPISWISSDEGIAVVDDGGEVTAVGVGVATITASDGKKQASCEITVKAASSEKPEEPEDPEDPDDPNAPKVTISSSTVTITVGGSVTLRASASDGSTVSWSSSDDSIASVLRGKVTGVGEGTAIITASSETAKAAKCTVKVNPQPKDSYELVWSDEFDGDSLDMSNWEYQTGIRDYYHGKDNNSPTFWGNEELQYYTDGANLKVADGSLQITAKREKTVGDDTNRTFTSARIATRDRRTFTYGYIEARMKTPAIEGMWPAFWMLPQPSSTSSTLNEYGSWPASGELDIMEAKGRLKNVVDSTLHFGGPHWRDDHRMEGKSTTLSSSTEEWHTYAVEWTAEYIAYVIDGKEVRRISNNLYWSSATQSPSAPFDKPYYIILNLAVGGQYDDYVKPPASFTQATMYVDYVRVYQKQN